MLMNGASVEISQQM